MKRPLEMSAAEIVESLSRSVERPPIGDGPIPNGVIALFPAQDLTDLIKRTHFVVVHRDYITRIIELLGESHA